MHPSPRHPTRLFNHGQARALTLATALVLGLSLGCTQAPDPGATTASAAPPPRELPAPLASEDQGQITPIPGDQAPGAPAKQEAASNIRYAYPTLLPERSVVAPLAVAPKAKIAQQDAYASPPPPPPLVAEDRERYAKLTDNGVFLTQEQPVSTFSIDVDTGSYANVRRFLNQGQLPPKDAVRTEELLNYFDYAYPQPRNRAQPLALHTEIAPTPWNPNTRLLLVGLQGYLPAERPAANLVFLIDVSGSMAAPNKLPLLISAFKLLTAQLGARDRVSLVTYAGNAGVVLEPTPGDQRAKILAALEQLGAGGSTHGAAGIQSAYRLAEQARLPEGINRVILATDGDFNVGMVNHEALIQLIEQERAKGISLTTLGFGGGNYNDQLMEQLADKGNGNYAYLDTLQEARKVLVDELASTLETIAGDVKLQIEFNPAQVAEYRLIGYENRLLAREDFNNDRVDAGEVGAGHSVTALYEITLAGSPPRIDPLRYGASSAAMGQTPARPESAAKADKTMTPAATDPAAANTAATAGELAFLKLRYKLPGQVESTLVTQALTAPSGQPEASERLRFAAAVAAFGQYLRGGATLNGLTLADIITLANGAKGEDASGYRAEFIGLARLAQVLPGA
ncbi:MAG: VWA domain-containing protein [Chromatiaceae bacterium]